MLTKDRADTKQYSRFSEIVNRVAAIPDAHIKINFWIFIF